MQDKFCHCKEKEAFISEQAQTIQAYKKLFLSIGKMYDERQRENDVLKAKCLEYEIARQKMTFLHGYETEEQVKARAIEVLKGQGLL